MRPTRTTALLLLLTPAVLAACATSRPAPPPRVVGVESCSASVALRLAGEPDAAPGTRPAADTATALFHGAGIDTSPEGAVALPGTLRAAWSDTLYRNADGTDAYRPPRMIRVTAVRIGHGHTGQSARHLEVDDVVPLRCGERGSHEIEIPRARTLRVTSDPAGASVFARVRTGAHGDEERFLGTTPAEIPLVWQPRQQFADIRLEKSGHTAATRRVARGEEEVRIILHPLPHPRH